MKYLFLLLVSLNSFAQYNHVPLSEAERYIEAASRGEGVAGLYECKDKPEEQCLDFSKCESWEVCELQDEYVDDRSRPRRNKFNIVKCKEPKVKESEEIVQKCESEFSELQCDQIDAEKFISEDFSEVYCSKVIGYDQVKSGLKVLLNSEAKKSAYKAAKEAEKAAKKAKDDAEAIERESRKTKLSSLKSVDWAQVTTLPKAVSILKDMVQVLKALEDK